MNIKHLFNTLFSADSRLVYMAGPEDPAEAFASPQEKTHESLDAGEEQKELIKLAERHIKEANDFAKKVKEYLKQFGDESDEFSRDASTRRRQEIRFELGKIEENISNLEAAVKSRTVTREMLATSRSRMNQYGKHRIARRINETVDPHDPMGAGINYTDRYKVDVSRPETVEKALDGVLQSDLAHNRYAIEGTWAEYSSEGKYNTELDDLAAARQLIRNRGERPEESVDSNLSLARELSDVMRLVELANKGEYVQEKPEALLAKQARLTNRLLRTSGARNLEPGGTVDLGFVTIHKAYQGEVYNLAVAEGKVIDGEPVAIPVETIIDLDYVRGRSKKPAGREAFANPDAKPGEDPYAAAKKASDSPADKLITTLS